MWRGVERLRFSSGPFRIFVLFISSTSTLWTAVQKKGRREEGKKGGREEGKRDGHSANGPPCPSVTESGYLVAYVMNGAILVSDPGGSAD